MKLKTLTLSSLLIAGTISFAQASDNAEKIFDTKCAACHSKTMPKDRNAVVAPALFGVMRHIKMAYPQKENAVKFMVDYVLEPSKEKAICMPQKIQRFGLMPSQKGNITEAELKEVAEWMFDNYPPKDFVGRGQGQTGQRCNGMQAQGKPSFENFDTNGDGVISPKEFSDFQAKRMGNKCQ